MLTGELPHPGNSLPEVCLAVMTSKPRPLKDFMPDVPDALEAILMKCLAKEPDQRFGSVAELAEQLLPFAPEWHLVVERATRLLGGAPNTVSYPPSLARSSNPPAGSSEHLRNARSSASTERISAPHMNDQSTPPSATEAPWSKTGPKGAKKRRGPLIIAALLGLLTALGLLIYATRKPELPALAALPSAARSSAPNPALGSTVVSEVHAALPAPPDVTHAADAEPVATRSVAPPSPAAAAEKSAPRVAPRPAEQAPGGPRYTYFGGRR
jgi:serine/threonine-protein kinase